MLQSIPRLPVFDWGTFAGAKKSATPCVLSQPTARYTVGGRAAILLALELLEVGPGDEVLVPTYHCPTMIAPIVARRAEVVFYPIDSTGAPDLMWLHKHATGRTRAILAAHYFGLPQPMAGLRAWCDQKGVRLIEDCAHALFGRSDGRAVGQWGDLAIASLTKFLPVPEGGCLVENLTLSPLPPLKRPGVKAQIRAAFNVFHAGASAGRLVGLRPLINAANGLRRVFKPKSTSPPQSADPRGDSFTIDVPQSHLALTAACRWIAVHAARERIVARRRENYLYFAQHLSGLPGLHVLHMELPDDCAPYVFALWVDHPDPGYAELRRLNFPVSRWDRLWPTVATIHGDFGIQWSHHVLQLACHQELTPRERNQMVETVARVYARSEIPPQAIKGLL